MLRLFPRLLCLILPIGVSIAAADAADLNGIVTHVRDGDTIEVGGVPIRLNGLHAPDKGPEAKRRATEFMKDLVLNQAVVCRLNGERSYDRLIGICWRGETDVARALIKAGLGRDCPRYSGGRYAGDEPQSVKTMPLPGYCISR